MSNRNGSVIKTVIEHNAPYWAGEFAVAYKYFTDGARTPEKDIRWIELQMFKEWTGSGVYGDRSVTVTGVVQKGLDELRRIEGGGAVKDLDRVSHLIQFGLDEFNHFKILYKLYRRIAPNRNVSIFEMGNLPEARKMVEIRHDFREHKPLGNTIVDLTEGGGLGMYFGIAKAFETVDAVSEEDQIIVEFAKLTVTDETGHMSHRFRKAMALGVSPQQWEDVDRGLQTLFAQKLAERNEQFGNVFSQLELDAMGRDAEAGKAYVSTNLGFLNSQIALAA
jgi:hypothetical protein